MTKQDLKEQIKQAIAQDPERERFKKVSLFGSYAYGSPRDDSDIDLLVEFSQPVGYFTLARIEERLSEKLGASIDVVTPRALSQFFRDDVLSRAEVVYEH